ncbi:hypothetical protein BMS3Abin01_00885 [bacterium BMS3Abin01]|nr:hypothetical protein BMS3Abin01_00885 [bacterium BMS3Abin01]
MRTESYLTRLDGLLATAVYHPRKTHKCFGMLENWHVSLGRVTGSPPGLASTTVTTIPGSTVGHATVDRLGVNTSATPVCGYRLSLHR